MQKVYTSKAQLSTLLVIHFRRNIGRSKTLHPLQPLIKKSIQSTRIKCFKSDHQSDCPFNSKMLLICSSTIYCTCTLSFNVITSLHQFVPQNSVSTTSFLFVLCITSGKQIQPQRSAKMNHHRKGIKIKESRK